MKRTSWTCTDAIVTCRLGEAIETQKYKLATIIIGGGGDVNCYPGGITPMMRVCLLPEKKDIENWNLANSYQSMVLI